MANDLKDKLKKLLASQGQKRFYFAYGVGKRKDGKGEGELAVHGKKLKKAEIEAELADGKEFFEGVCWTGQSPETSDTIYFQGRGKKLSPPIIAKMIKTAKGTAGHQYDFQIPSPEEEARVEKLSEGTEEESTEGVPVAPPVTAPTPPSGGAEVLKRLNALSAAIKTALAGPNKVRVQSLFVHVNGLIKSSDFAQAGTVLDELEGLVAQSTSPPTSPPSPHAGGAEVIKRLNAMSPDIKLALAGPEKARVQGLFVKVNGLVKANDFAQAGQVLDELAALLKSNSAGGQKPREQEQPKVSPEFAGLWKKATAAWDRALETVNGQLDKLRGNLLKSDDPDLKNIAEFGLNAITANHKVPLQVAIMDVNQASDSAMEEKVSRAQDAVAAFRDHIETDERALACDNNPFNVNVTLRAELVAAFAKLNEALDEAFV
jgi:hypothetical protein